MIPAWLSFFDGLLAIALVIVGMVVAHFGLAASFLGFQLFVLGFLLAILGFIIGLIGLARTISPRRAVARPRAIVGTVIGIVIAVPVLVIVLSNRYPAINDITTDVNNPPEFVHAETLAANHGRNMTYNKARFAARQQAGYGTIAPLKIAAPPAQIFARVEAVAAKMPSWKITYADPATMSLEGTSTSALFRFEDDFVIQVRPAADSGGSLVEMRSKSRVGVGDFGVNAKRIRSFFAAMKAARRS